MILQQLIKLEQQINSLLNDIELFKFAYITNDKKLNTYQNNVNDNIHNLYNDLKDRPIIHTSLLHYKFFNFLTDCYHNPIEPLDNGNTKAYIEDIQRRLLLLHESIVFILK
jgi:hypothetical protein